MTTELRRASAPDTPQFRSELGRWLAASTRQTTRQAGRRSRRRVAMLALAGLVALGLVVAVPVLGPQPAPTSRRPSRPESSNRAREWSYCRYSAQTERATAWIRSPTR